MAYRVQYAHLQKVLGWDIVPLHHLAGKLQLHLLVVWLD